MGSNHGTILLLGHIGLVRNSSHAKAAENSAAVIWQSVLPSKTLFSGKMHTYILNELVSVSA